MNPTEDTNMPLAADTDESDTSSPPPREQEEGDYDGEVRSSTTAGAASGAVDTVTNSTTTSGSDGQQASVVIQISGAKSPRSNRNDHDEDPGSNDCDDDALSTGSKPRGTSVTSGTRSELTEEAPQALSSDGYCHLEAGSDMANEYHAVVSEKMAVENKIKHHGKKEGEEQPSQCSKDPDGSRTAASQFTSRRFDEEMLQEVMRSETEDEEEKKMPERDLPSTIFEEEPHVENDTEEIQSFKYSSPRKPPDEQETGPATRSENPAEDESVRSSKEPSGTPAERRQDVRDISPMPEEDVTLPSFPSEAIFTDEQQASEDISFMDEGSPDPKQPASLFEEDISSMLNDDLQSIYSVHMQQQAHALSAVLHPMPGAPIAAPSPAHVIHTMDLDAVQRTSVASAGSSAYHYAHHGILSQQPQSNMDMSIPHMPPLVLPASTGRVPAAQAPVHGNGYHISALALAPGPSSRPMMPAGGKRRIHLRLEEDVQPTERSLFSSFRKRSILRKNPLNSPINETEPTSGQKKQHWVDRGTLTVSWYEGTSTLELQEHVRNSVVRKLRLEGTTTKLAGYRILDDSVDPPEEIVLCPYVPTGSRLLLRFTTKDAGGEATPVHPRFSDYNGGPPESPSAAPSPHPRIVDLGGLGLNANQLALLGARLKGLQMPSPEESEKSRRLKIVDGKNPLPTMPAFKVEGRGLKEEGDTQGKDSEDDDNSKDDSNFEVASLHPEDPVQKSLREITELLMAERKGNQRYAGPRQEKRQVIFVLANYFVLFLSLIAISAEIQARAPEWHAAMERHLKNVQNCSKDQESLFECVENGDFAGLIASVVLWISRSAATKRIFLFGFESPKRLWTVVYESLVTAVCWGFSYIFIRRGMNPDTNRNFLQKYWKDAVYGSLAGFNAAFMKHVLKNLIPQEAIEDALQERQLKILSWLPSFS